MSISYPNGKKYLNRMTQSKQINKTFANRGMTLEDDLNNTNHFYLETGRAAIYKKPTPVQIVNVSYPKRSAAVIKEAYFKQPSTTDYNGIYKGKYIDFEAKETKNKTSFPLNNFHEHQVAHMKRIMTHGGIGFIIIRFSMTDEIYLLENQHLISYWEKQHHGGRKSIPKEYITQHGFSIKIGFSPRIDYLNVIDTIYFKDHNN